MSVLTYLLALPNHARVTLRALAAPSVERRSGIVAALRELEELRYLRRVVCEDGEGRSARQLRVVYEVFDAPYEVAPQTGETEKVPSLDAPTRMTVRAAHLLLSLGRIDPRLTLDAAEALRLAPLVERWWERGVSSARVRAALAYDWPGPVISAAAHIEACLVSGCPERSTPVPVTAVEVDCRRPGGGLLRGLLKRRVAPA
ncbi:hypothetical protein [Streptomyces sp. bgisy027]|uniref:hypothetical protein n=1 Tax=Streptomyces sp. bgisy027 TaxID=3413770 RepID=UPI003D72A5CE